MFLFCVKLLCSSLVSFTCDLIKMVVLKGDTLNRRLQAQHICHPAFKGQEDMIRFLLGIKYKEVDNLLSLFPDECRPIYRRLCFKHSKHFILETFWTGSGFKF
ncbi:hypothetical protein ATANTOWER_003082 [Ataeniobius toweri]|uniref:Uncharacterized protein n=1 Tax=Ataeniobius toweri TaxID=208326 RepID=A0ABU7ADP8_9TELE|nr:hypothetical protein [Ataeniobius toweri]